MDTRKSLISRVSVHRTIPTRIPSYDFRASGEAATTVQDAVEKQVFADCTDRGTTAAWVVSRRSSSVIGYRLLLSHNPCSGLDRGAGHETPRSHNFTRRRNGWMAIRLARAAEGDAGDRLPQRHLARSEFAT